MAGTLLILGFALLSLLTVYVALRGWSKGN